jgi:Uncharacterized protein conserved in bacteria (DUF2141)
LCEVTSLAEPVAAADRGRVRFVGAQRLPSGPGRDGAIPRLATTGALAIYLSVLAALLSGAAPAGYRLTVEVENVRNAQGVVGVLVFNTAQGWPEKFSAALRAEARAAHTGVVEITLPDLPAGDYAVVGDRGKVGEFRQPGALPVPWRLCQTRHTNGRRCCVAPR